MSRLTYVSLGSMFSGVPFESPKFKGAKTKNKIMINIKLSPILVFILQTIISD